MGKKKKSDKSLGQDPFEDMERMDWEDELPPGSDWIEPPTEEEGIESASGETEAEARPETEPVEAAADPEVEPAKAEESQAAEPTEEAADLKSEIQDLQSEGPALGEAEGVVEGSEAATEVEPPDKEVESASGETEAEIQSETEPVETAADPEVEGFVVAEPDEEANQLLEDLMATIDEEVEEAFGPGAMTDPTIAEPADRGKGEEQYVIFRLSGSEYAVLAHNVREIGEPPNTTPVPNVPDWVLGVANLRGDVLSLVDLRLFLGMERKDYDDDTRVMVVHAQRDGSSVTTGLIVDLVSDILYLPADRITAPAAPIEDQVAPYLRGVYEHDGHLLVVLSLDRLLLSPEMRQFEPV